MKTYLRHKTSGEIVRQCRAQGVRVSLALHKIGSDYITVGRNKIGHGYVLYNVVNGGFFGHTPSGEPFASDSDRHDGTPWMQALLEFFYSDEART